MGEGCRGCRSGVERKKRIRMGGWRRSWSSFEMRRAMWNTVHGEVTSVEARLVADKVIAALRKGFEAWFGASGQLDM